jgi:hypothetical protein
MDITVLPLNDIKTFLTYFQIVTALVGTFNYYKYRSTFLKYFLYLLWYVVINDFSAKIYSENFSIYNAFLYNIYQFISFSFFFLMYEKAVKSVVNKNIIQVLKIIYYLIFIFYIFNENFIEDYFSTAYMIGGFFVICAVTLFLLEILNSHKIIHINKMLIFWISIALLLSVLPNIPFNVIRKYYCDSATIPYIYAASYLLVFIYNVLIISGFIWCSKEQKRYY